VAQQTWKRVAVQETRYLEQGEDAVAIEWQLPGEQDPAWNFAFLSAAQDRTGPAAFRYGPDPTIDGAVIRWTVPKEFAQPAAAEVLKRVGVANTAYRHVLEERASAGPVDA
jgi:hypothetical protein